MIPAPRRQCACSSYSGMANLLVNGMGDLYGVGPEVLGIPPSSVTMLLKDVIQARKPTSLLVRMLESAAAASGRELPAGTKPTPLEPVMLPATIIDERNGGRTPLMTAADVGRPDLVNLLLSFGADPRYCDPSDGRTALHLCCDGLTPGHGDCALALVAAGTDVNASDKRGWTALHLCCKRWEVMTDGVVRSLLRAGADPGNRIAGSKRTCMHSAAAFGATRLLAMLVSCGADLRSRDASKMTPLHCAVEEGRVDCALVLVSLGASPSERDWRGWTCAGLATRHKHAALASALLLFWRMPVVRVLTLLKARRASPKLETPASGPGSSAAGDSAATGSESCAAAAGPAAEPAAAPAAAAAAVAEAIGETGSGSEGGEDADAPVLSDAKIARTLERLAVSTPPTVWRRVIEFL